MVIFKNHLTLANMFENTIIPARDPKKCEGAKGYETRGGDDDDDDDDDDDEAQMKAQRSRHMRAQRRADISEHTKESAQARAHI